MIDIDEEIDTTSAGQVDAFDPIGQQRPVIRFFEIRFQLMPLQRLVLERKLLGVFFDKEVKRVDHGHFRNQLNVDHKFGYRFWKDDPRDLIAKGILLPVKMVLGWFDL